MVDDDNLFIILREKNHFCNDFKPSSQTFISEFDLAP